MEKKNGSRPIALTNIQVEDSFWKNAMELVRKEVIPYQWDALNDKVEGAAPSFCMRNYKLAGKITKNRKLKDYQEKIWTTGIFETLPEDMNHLEDRFYGFLFQDSDFSKWIEAVGYSLTQHPDEELEKVADEAIDIVCAAQQENGYLDTFYIINDMSKVFSNLRDNHELYCFGHLAEGAVAYYQATGKDKLLKAACRYADYIDECFGREEGKINGYPGHEIAEMALVRLYEVTGEKKYLELANYFVTERGVRPYYFDKEFADRVKPGKEQEERYHYHQAHKPVKQQDEAVGHAVRAVYLYSGMADIARITGDEEMYQACERLWENITTRKMYITGGIGATHLGEAFSFNYDLPNDTAYSETCASIGLIFFARRMLEIQAHSKYSDVMERALYNCVLAGMALDGKSFFYVNPLEVLPEACHRDERKFHVKSVRQKWFGCACCPPNIARLLSSIASYAYTENEDTLFMHLHMGGKVEKVFGEQEIGFEVTSEMPWNGKVTIRNNASTSVAGKLAIRIPGWCKEYTLNGETFANVESKDLHNGYLYLDREWKKEDVIELEFAMNIR
ncbi:MAG: glycoside hydrolase family 127 protein, partial [Eubacterium sp.]|nr:glycoside hydrolase family 127 protein [Eubacterium sp.]